MQNNLHNLLFYARPESSNIYCLNQQTHFKIDLDIQNLHTFGLLKFKLCQRGNQLLDHFLICVDGRMLYTLDLCNFNNIKLPDNLNLNKSYKWISFSQDWKTTRMIVIIICENVSYALNIGVDKHNVSDGLNPVVIRECIKLSEGVNENAQPLSLVLH